MSQDRTSSKQDLTSIVAMVVELAHPLRVVLFGSVARGEERLDSDVDLMVLVPDGTNRLQVAKQLYGLGIPDVDFVVTTPSLLAARQDSPNYVHHDIVRDGRELYAA